MEEQNRGLQKDDGERSQLVDDLKSDVYGEQDESYVLSSNQPIIQGYSSTSAIPMQNILKPHEHLSSEQIWVPVTCFAVGLILFIVCDLFMQIVFLFGYFIGLGWISMFLGIIAGLLPFIPFVIGSFYIFYPSSTAKCFAWMNLCMAVLTGFVLLVIAIIVVIHGVLLVALTTGMMIFTLIFSICLPLAIIVVIVIVVIVVIQEDNNY